jgi:hypothetical protein
VALFGDEEILQRQDMADPATKREVALFRTRNLKDAWTLGASHAGGASVVGNGVQRFHLTTIVVSQRTPFLA